MSLASAVRDFYEALLRRRLLLAVIVAVWLTHFLGLLLYSGTPRGIFISNLGQALGALVACIWTADAARRGSGHARILWGLASLAFAIWCIGQLNWLYHVSWGSGRVPRISIALIFFRFYTAPLMLALAMDLREQPRRVDWQGVLDTVQLGLVVFLAYLVVDFGSGLSLQMMNSRVVDVVFALNPLNWAMGFAALARVRMVRSSELGRVWQRLGTFFLLYAPVAGFANVMIGVYDPTPASWWDLSWTTPLLLGAALAGTWEPKPEEYERQQAPSPLSKRLATVMYAALPLFVLTLAALVAPQQRWMAAIAVVLSLACYGGRLVLTQLRQEESYAALRVSEERYRALFQTSLVGVVRSRPDGQLLDCNEAMARILGYTREEALARPVQDFYPDPSLRAARIAALRAHGSIANIETEFRHKDGRLVSVLQNVILRKESDGNEVIETTLVDLTDRKLLEQQLFQAQKMEAVGRLAGGVAHDFNNLLSVILGYSDLLVEALSGDAKNRARAEGVRGAGERAAALTRQLLAFSRQQVLEPRTLDLRRSLMEMQSLLRRLIGEDIQLILQPGKKPALVRADPSQIEQVIMNLAVNARDAMPQGGKLTIEIADALIDVEQARRRPGVEPGDYVMLALSDTGLGMSEEIQSRIFEPFFTTKDKGKGTGLGLATVFGIVKQSGGHVWFYSEPGHGTTFKIYLPRDAEHDAPERLARDETRPAGGSEAILVVEDETSLRELTTEFLLHGGYVVRAARNGEEALEWALQNSSSLHLLVTDVVLPGMSGRTLAEKLAAHRKGIKVLYVSGYTDDAIVQHGVLESSLAFLQKPFSRDALLRKVRETLDGTPPA